MTDCDMTFDVSRGKCDALWGIISAWYSNVLSICMYVLICYIIYIIIKNVTMIYIYKSDVFRVSHAVNRARPKKERERSCSLCQKLTDFT